MIFTRGSIEGAWLIDLERRTDERGYFARVFCADELRKQGLVDRFEQVNTGFNPQSGTLRGLHYQEAPHAEVKIARCTRGAVFDVAVDLRPASSTFRQWMGATLTADDGRMLYVPEGCAHGYFTLCPDTELVYFTSCIYAPAAARGVRYDDPAFGIPWPGSIRIVSQADRSWPDFVLR